MKQCFAYTKRKSINQIVEAVLCIQRDKINQSIELKQCFAYTTRNLSIKELKQCFANREKNQSINQQNWSSALPIQRENQSINRIEAVLCLYKDKINQSKSWSRTLHTEWENQPINRIEAVLCPPGDKINQSTELQQCFAFR